jgi:hypothetical protein
LFWNHSDATLAEKGHAFVAQYADASTPLISVEGVSNPSHFDVIDFMVNRRGASRFAASVKEVVHAFRPEPFTAMLHRDFRHMLSRLRLQRVDELLRGRHARLIKVCG